MLPIPPPGASVPLAPAAPPPLPPRVAEAVPPPPPPGHEYRYEDPDDPPPLGPAPPPEPGARIVPSLEFPAPTGLSTVASLLPGEPAPPTPPSAEAIPAKLEEPPVPPRAADPPLMAPPVPGAPGFPTTTRYRWAALAITSLMVTAPAAPPAPPAWSEIPFSERADPPPPPPPPAPIATTVYVPDRGATHVPLTVKTRMSAGRPARGLPGMVDTDDDVGVEEAEVEHDASRGAATMTMPTTTPSLPDREDGCREPMREITPTTPSDPAPDATDVAEMLATESDAHHQQINGWSFLSSTAASSAGSGCGATAIQPEGMPPPDPAGCWHASPLLPLSVKATCAAERTRGCEDRVAAPKRWIFRGNLGPTR